MQTLDSRVDTENLTLTATAHFDAGVDRVWQVWENPRLLERWWGPPTWPATFDQHDFVPGGDARYYMTGPEGEKAHGWWRFVAIDAPHRIELEDGFADAEGNPDPAMGSTRMVLTLEEVDGGTRMTIVSTFESAEQLDQMVSMGMQEGLTGAISQIDGLLAEA
jgi:uncharacterized protein YndB with AHSA1/START domain